MGALSGDSSSEQNKNSRPKRRQITSTWPKGWTIGREDRTLRNTVSNTRAIQTAAT